MVWPWPGSPGSWFGVLREGRRRALIGQRARDHQDRQKPRLGGVLLNLRKLLSRHHGSLTPGESLETRQPRAGTPDIVLFLFYLFYLFYFILFFFYLYCVQAHSPGPQQLRAGPVPVPCRCFILGEAAREGVAQRWEEPRAKPAAVSA